MYILPKKLMILGSGELGKELTIAAKRLGCFVIACDKYSNAPAMQVADEALVFDMQNESILINNIYTQKPDVIIPEIEALAVNALQRIEQEGFKVIPNSRAVSITMNRDKIRDLAAKELGIKTAKFAYVSNKKDIKSVIKDFSFPVIIKPIMSSSGKGQTLVKNILDLEKAWDQAIKEARGKSKKIIIEEFINFDLEITLLTIKQKSNSTIFCDPIGHEQSNGDYQSSWQPANIKIDQLNQAKSIAKQITDNLGGEGLFGVEFFIVGDEVIFSELSPRPHDTGLVTIISQELNEFELHLYAILGLPLPDKIHSEISSSRVILSNKNINSVSYSGIEKALLINQTKVLLFGKPNAKEGRRMGVALAKGKDIQQARLNADKASKSIKIFEKSD